MSISVIEIKKDTMMPSKPWYCDLTFDDGVRFTSFMYGYRTKKAMIKQLEAVAGGDVSHLII